MGDTEIPMQSLRGRYKKLLAHNPKTDSSLMEDEYGVRGVARVCVAGWLHGGRVWHKGCDLKGVWLMVWCHGEGMRSVGSWKQIEGAVVWGVTS